MNYNFLDESDQTALSFGIRVRKILHDSYYYETNSQLIMGEFESMTIVPFIEMNNELGKVIINSRLSYSYFPDGSYFGNVQHPIFSKVGLSFGLKYRFAKTE